MLKFSANLSTLFQEHALLDRVTAAAAAGFKGVEIWFPYEVPAHALRERLDAYGLQCVMINTVPGDTARGDWGLAVDVRRRSEFIASVQQALDYAQAIGCTRVHVMSGAVPQDRSLADAEAAFAHSIADACDMAREVGITVMIEPLNHIDRPTFYLTRQAQAIALVRELARDNLGIMLDLFHLQRGEGNLIERMLQSLPYAAHVQFADVPGRHEPGTGEIHFPRVFAALVQANWSGWVGCEYFPVGTTAASLGWMHALMPVD